MSEKFVKFLKENRALIRNNMKKYGFATADMLNARIFNQISYYAGVDYLVADAVDALKNDRLDEWLDLALDQAISDFFDSNGVLLTDVKKALFLEEIADERVSTSLLQAYLCEIVSSRSTIAIEDAINSGELTGLNLSGYQQLLDCESMSENEKIRYYYSKKINDLSSILASVVIDKQFVETSKNKQAVIAFKQQQQQQKNIVDKACKEYQRHLLNEIEKYYPIDGNVLNYAYHIILPFACGERVLPCQLAFNDTKIEQNAGFSLEIAIEKYNLLADMRAELHKKSVSVTHQLSNFAEKLNQPKSLELLNTNRDSGVVKFLKAVGFLISMVVSKVHTGTFAFWKPHGRVFAEHLRQNSLLSSVAVLKAN